MKLSPSMRALLWEMLQYRRDPRRSGVLVINDERTARALVRRGLLTEESGGYQLNERAARRALSK